MDKALGSVVDSLLTQIRTAALPDMDGLRMQLDSSYDSKSSKVSAPSHYFLQAGVLAKNSAHPSLLEAVSALRSKGKAGPSPPEALVVQGFIAAAEEMWRCLRDVRDQTRKAEELADMIEKQAAAKSAFESGTLDKEMKAMAEKSAEMLEALKTRHRIIVANSLNKIQDMCRNVFAEFLPVVAKTMAAKVKAAAAKAEEDQESSGDDTEESESRPKSASEAKREPPQKPAGPPPKGPPKKRKEKPLDASKQKDKDKDKDRVASPKKASTPRKSAEDSKSADSSTAFEDLLGLGKFGSSDKRGPDGKQPEEDLADILYNLSKGGKSKEEMKASARVEELKKSKERENAAQTAEEEALARVGAKIEKWEYEQLPFGGRARRKGILELLSTIDTVIWDGCELKDKSRNIRPESFATISVNEVRKAVRRVQVVCHPDKQVSASAEQRVIARAVFEAVTSAFEEYRSTVP